MSSATAPKFSYIKIKEEYVLITSRNFCAAKILAIIEGWLEWKAKHKKKYDDWDWVRLPLDKIRECLFGEYSLETIRSAVGYLCKQLKLIDRRLNERAPYDRAYQYQLNQKAIQRAIAKLSKGAETLTNDDPLNDEVSSPSSVGVIPKIDTNVNEIESPDSSPDESTFPEAESEINSEPEEQESDRSTPVEKHSLSTNSLPEVEQIAEDQSSAAAPTSIFEKMKDKGLKPKQPKPTAPEEFRQWYAEAQKRSLVIASQLRDSVQWVCMRGEVWIEWQVVAVQDWETLGLKYPRVYVPPFEPAPTLPEPEFVPDEPTFQETLEKYREWLSDPILRRDAIAWANGHPDVEVVFGADGGIEDLREVPF